MQSIDSIDILSIYLIHMPTHVYQIWATEIDKYHAVVASHEAEVRQIQAKGKPSFQGQGGWDKLGWAWKKIGSSPSQPSQTEMTKNSPGV